MNLEHISICCRDLLVVEKLAEKLLRAMKASLYMPTASWLGTAIFNKKALPHILFPKSKLVENSVLFLSLRCNTCVVRNDWMQSKVTEGFIPVLSYTICFPHATGIKDK